LSEKYDEAESSKSIKERVQKARDIQLERFKDASITANSEMRTKEINKFCQLERESDILLKEAVDRLKLSARSYYRILKLARTIADLSGEEKIASSHILEALSFRKKED